MLSVNCFNRVLVIAALITCSGFAKPRARDLGIEFHGTPGPLNMITDIKGVEVGHRTIIAGKSKFGVVHGVARTGVTVLFPRGKNELKPVPAGFFALNGNGEMTGQLWVEESGLLDAPIALTNTLSVGVVRDAIAEWVVKTIGVTDEAPLPVVAETDDSWLNDLYGFHVKKEHVFEAIKSASSGVISEGNVGGGTANVTFRFKAGIGTSSRKTKLGFIVGALVQSNFGARDEMTLSGKNIGKKLRDMMPIENPLPKKTDGSIIVIIGTDAPLLPHQLKRVAKRVGLALGRLGSTSHNSSGDIFMVFSTARPIEQKQIELWKALKLDDLDGIFEASVDATEEAIVNALVAAETMDGVNGNKVFAAPWDRIISILNDCRR